MARVSGGGDGAFGGDSVFTEETLARNGTGAAMSFPSSAAGQKSEDDESLSEIESMLSGGGGESLVMDNAMKHVITRLTDEGLIIELFDLENEALFEEGSAVPTPILKEISKMMAEVFGIVKNEVAVNGHTMSQPIVLVDNQVWDLSSARADQLRRLLEGSGFDAQRIQRVTGYADRKPAVRNPMAKRNNRMELILLRTDK